MTPLSCPFSTSWIDRLPTAAEMHHAGGRNGLLGHRGGDLPGDEAPVVDEHRPPPGDAAVHPEGVHELHAALERHLLFRLVELDALQPGDEVEVPIGAAVFAVGGGA